ncbi:Inositol hexakisphosphate kinase 1 (InsP6 kinase 1) (InsP6 kinase KCS1) (PKC1 suppressor protein 1) [Durusdinium trenchii]|uniref:Kinase n=1 Tax=Durusdinium trenchii TaxID=1381693 RepID=A0ABP0KN55_9DINO
MVITAVRRGQAQVVRPDRQIILKKATANEKAFYEAEECASLESFLPMYYGCALVCTEFGNEDYLVLEDVALSNPVQCDVKLGFVQRAAHHSDAKWKSMRVKAAATTSAKVGFRHCGLTYCDWKSGIQVKEDKYAGQLVQAADLVSAFGKFFNQEPGRTWPLQGAFRKSVLKSISTIHALEGVIASLDGLRFWGASLLFMLDAEAIWNQDAACIDAWLTLVPLTWGQYGLWILWSIVTSLGPRNVVFLAKEVFPQLANTTFFFSAHTSPGVRGLVALTIDDGICRGDRSKSMLPEVLKLLRSFEAKATFFLSSHYVHGNDLPRLVFEGHEPANHMPEDKEYASSSAKSFEAALAETDDVVRPFLKASQKRWFRAPQARLTMEMAEVLQARNMTHALGDCYADDWAIPDPVRVASVYLRQVQEGSVVIMHMPQEGFRQHTYEVLYRHT